MLLKAMIWYMCMCVSCCRSPQAAFYILQHSKTMGLRFRQQCKTAQAVAEMLESHENVKKENGNSFVYVPDWCASVEALP